MNRHKTGKSKGGSLLSEILIWHSKIFRKKKEREKEKTDPKLENKI